jgi:hypothetical protein
MVIFMSLAIPGDPKKPRSVRNTGTREDMELKERIKGACRALARAAVCRSNESHPALALRRSGPLT